METDESQNTGIVTEKKCNVLLHKPLLTEEKPFSFFLFELYKYSFKNQAHYKISKTSGFVEYCNFSDGMVCIGWIEL